MGWVGRIDDAAIDFGLGDGRLLKIVVLPLKALMLKDNLAEGNSVPQKVEAQAAEAEEEFKDIL